MTGKTAWSNHDLFDEEWKRMELLGESLPPEEVMKNIALDGIRQHAPLPNQMDEAFLAGMRALSNLDGPQTKKRDAALCALREYLEENANHTT